MQNHLNSLQFVFISIDYRNLAGTIETIDKYIPFVKEYIIVTRPDMMEQFKELVSTHKIILVNENDILNEYVDGFASRDHVSKNWLLRTSLLMNL